MVINNQVQGQVMRFFLLSFPCLCLRINIISLFHDDSSTIFGSCPAAPFLATDTIFPLGLRGLHQSSASSCHRLSSGWATSFSPSHSHDLFQQHHLPFTTCSPFSSPAPTIISIDYHQHWRPWCATISISPSYQLRLMSLLPFPSSAASGSSCKSLGGGSFTSFLGQPPGLLLPCRCPPMYSELSPSPPMGSSKLQLSVNRSVTCTKLLPSIDFDYVGDWARSRNLLILLVRYS